MDIRAFMLESLEKWREGSAIHGPPKTASPRDRENSALS
jgi:hypothetical protein